ncbi:hypothetical protein IJT93_04870 [bacterium]|nr:hypothetical protein [bacterium]
MNEEAIQKTPGECVERQGTGILSDRSTFSEGMRGTLPGLDCKDVRSQLITAEYADKRVGERFEFGRYPQGANGEAEPITWRVLRRDSGALLVISEYGLDAKPYNEEFESITWSKCTLRRWLNDEFLQKAFNPQEQSLIKVSSLSNNAGLSADDRVFLLSIDEVKRLFVDEKDRIAKVTAYAAKCGAYTYNEDGITWWWLRSRNYDGNYAAFVNLAGVIGSRGLVDRASGSVRPALRIAI